MSPSVKGWLAGTALIAAALAGFMAMVMWQLTSAKHALRAAGYGEFTLRGGAVASPCAFPSFTTIFLAQGGRLGRETQGYVCTSFYEPPTIHEGLRDGADALDWHD